MKRQIVYAGQVPLETDLLNTNKNVLTAIGHVLQDMLGTSTLFSGLGCVPTSPAGMTVNVNPGRAYSLQATDTGAYSSLSADATQLMKQGILLAAQNFSCPAPTTAGFSINYLIQGAFQEVDGGSTVLPYYNAANPAQAFNGPNGTGTSNTTFRDNTVQLQLKAGTAATTGTQTTPAVDSGFTGLWVITVAFGAVTITSANISQFTGAPFLTAPLLAQVQSAPNGVVGQVRNLAMTVSAASATATLTADEIIVGTALGGQMFKLSSISKAINLATTGAGGMDTGAAPASSFVGIYAILNTTTGTAALLGVSANAVTLPNVYGGANMPAGFTASALLTVVPTNGSSLILPCVVQDRSVDFGGSSILSTSTTAASPTTVNNLIVPLNAKNCSGFMQIGNTAAASMSMGLYSSSASMGLQSVALTLSASGSIAAPFNKLKITIAQRVFYTGNSSAGTPTFSAQVTSYEI